MLRAVVIAHTGQSWTRWGGVLGAVTRDVLLRVPLKVEPKARAWVPIGVDSGGV